MLPIHKINKSIISRIFLDLRYCQNRRSSRSISIVQNIFVNTLGKEIPRYASGLDPRIMANAGAINLRQVMSMEQCARRL
jgi:hypothetical protein